MKVKKKIICRLESSYDSERIRKKKLKFQNWNGRFARCRPAFVGGELATRPARWHAHFRERRAARPRGRVCVRVHTHACQCARTSPTSCSVARAQLLWAFYFTPGDRFISTAPKTVLVLYCAEYRARVGGRYVATCASVVQIPSLSWRLAHARARIARWFRMLNIMMVLSLR